MRRPLSIILNVFQDLPRPALALAALLLTPTLHAACTNPAGQAGTVIYNSSYNVIQYCNGSNWINTGNKNASAANTGCTNPTGKRGDVIYNTTAKVTQFCNGEAWQNMACSRTATSGGSGCTNPVGLPGTLSFVTPANKLQMCDGTNWLNTGMPCGPLPPALYCWGYNSSGGLGDGTTTNSSVPVQVTLPSGVTAFNSVSVGSTHTCGIANNDVSYCWGYNRYGQLGNGTTSTSPQTTPVPVSLPSGVSKFTFITAGDDTTCGVANNNKTYCWGENSHGTLGNGTTTNSSVPLELSQPSGTTTFISIEIGNLHACGFTDNGNAYCWGTNGYGQLGIGNTIDSNTPVRVSSLDNVIAITAKANMSCAITNDGTAWCWGGGDYGQLGNGNTNRSSTPVLVNKPAGVTRFTAIGLGIFHTCGMGNNGRMYCWGRNDDGAIGNGTTTSTATPVPVNLPSGVSSFTQIDLGSQGSCALGNDKKAYCWGSGGTGQLGNGSTSNANTPVPVTLPANLTKFNNLSTGGIHACGIIQ